MREVRASIVDAAHARLLDPADTAPLLAADVRYRRDR
jgi:hypothetical protein